MKIYIDPNGWTIHIKELDPRHINSTDLFYLKTLPYTNLLVIIHDTPSLTPIELQTFSHTIFSQVQNNNLSLEKRFLPGTNREIMRVSGRRNEKGEIIGLFGMPEYLMWHCDHPGEALNTRPDCLLLYSVDGCEDTVNGFTNGIFAFQDLKKAKDAPPGLIKNLDKIEVHYAFSVDQDELKGDINYVGISGKNKLLIKNKAGIEGIMFSNSNSTDFFINQSKLPDKVSKLWKDYLTAFLTRPKYVYNHNWKNNQIILNCQFLSQHDRKVCPTIGKRLLWRMMGSVENFDYKLQINFPEYPQL